MAYYTSNNREDLEAYNAMVTINEGYNGTTQKWANVIEHKDGGQFAILKHEVHVSDSFQEVESLEGWFEIEEV